MLSRCFFDFSVGVGAFVVRLSQISSFFSHFWFRGSPIMVTVVLSIICATVKCIRFLFFKHCVSRQNKHIKYS